MSKEFFTITILKFAIKWKIEMKSQSMVGCLLMNKFLSTIKYQTSDTAQKCIGCA
jgi:hypothetical protein